MHSQGLGYWEIGLVLAVYNGAGALLLPLTFRKTPSTKKTVVVQTVLYLPAAILIPMSGGPFVIAMILMMALGESISYIITESLVSRAVAGYGNVATAIGFLFVPSNFATMIALVSAGLLVERFGYTAPFWVAGLFFLIYCISAWQILRNRN